jgi:D-alanyl-D-alanine carboxypeptidase (penicillin-binding protein 5/6)
MDTLRDGAFGLANTNKLLRTYAGTTGLKTGSTDAAGFCISASAERDGMELIAVVLGSKTSKERFATAQNLLNFGFAGWRMVDLTPEEPIPAVPVTLGKEDTVSGSFAGSLRLLVEKGQEDSLTTTYAMAEGVEAPVAVGTRLGSLQIYQDGTLVQEVEIQADRTVARKTLRDVLEELWRTMAMQE